MTLLDRLKHPRASIRLQARKTLNLHQRLRDEMSGGVESKAGRTSPVARWNTHQGQVVKGKESHVQGGDALAGIAQAIKSAQPTVRKDCIPEQPEAAHTADRQIAGVAPGPLISPWWNRGAFA